MLEAPNYQYPEGASHGAHTRGTVPMLVDHTGVYVAERVPPPAKFAPISATVVGDTQLVAAVPNKKIRVLGYMLTADIGPAAVAAVDVQFRSGPTTVLAQLQDLNGQMAVSYAGGVSAPAFETAAGAALNINLSAVKIVAGHLTYMEVD